MPECVGACFGVGQRDFRRYDGWVRLGCIEKERCVERRLTSSNLFCLELKFRGKRWLALKGEPPPGEARVNVGVRSDQIYDPRNYLLWCANTSLNEFLFIFAL